jgi:hypothetical protein
MAAMSISGAIVAAPHDNQKICHALRGMQRLPSGDASFHVKG